MTAEVVDAGRPDPQNRAMPPLVCEELQRAAAALFDGIARHEPTLADPFFFPQEPFLSLKAVSDPGRYWRQLIEAYHRDVLTLSSRTHLPEGARFVSFELGTRPQWVAPGEEYNKIGYYRTFHGRLQYEAAGRRASLDVMTVISWGGRWYVTHLLPIRHESSPSQPSGK